MKIQEQMYNIDVWKDPWPRDDELKQDFSCY